MNANVNSVNPSEQLPDKPDKATILAVVQLLRKYGLKNTEDILVKESNVDISIPGVVDRSQSDSDVSNVLCGYKSDSDPKIYEDVYADLQKFVDSSLDTYKYELGTILYPVFVHMYLELIYNNHEDDGIKFMNRFIKSQEDYYQDDLRRISFVTKREQMKGNEITETFKSSEFIIRMSRDTLSLLKKHLLEKKQAVVLSIIKEHLFFDMYEGVARNKAQIDATAGAMVGEATRQDNKTKVYYGLLKEPDVQFVPGEEEEGEGEGGEGDKPKKKKSKKDSLFSKKAKTDPNAPPADRMPLPELKDADKMEKMKAMREANKRVTLGPEVLPSICMYTVLNAGSTVTAAEICEDSSQLAVGFMDSVVKVFSLTPQKLRGMKSAEALQDVDKEADDVLVRMMDDKSVTVKTLCGHFGVVYRLSFSPDRSLLLSCSEDSTIRLWSLQTWTCLVVYKGHTFPVWDVRFSPHGYYFATGSHDRTARLWATDQPQPLRIFVGHYSDVEVIQFHPNSNYIASGSSDRTIRLWDNVSGSQVRLMTGHKAQIHSLAFSCEGRFLASAGADKKVFVWDLAHGHLLAELSGHTSTIHSLAFSRDGNILASGGLDFQIKLWDFAKLAEEMNLEEVNVSHNPDVKTNSEDFLIRSYSTKNSPILALHFTRRNLMLGVSMYDS